MTSITVNIDGQATVIGVPFLVSEHEPGGWEDCTWATGVMLGNFMWGADRWPATRDAYEDLRFAGTGVREASGDGSNLGELEDGMRALYGFAGERIGGLWSSVLAKWPIGWAGALQGKYSALPSRLRFSSAFGGGHCLLAIRISAGEFLDLDPLRANGAPAVKATAAEMGNYYTALGGAVMIAGYRSAQWRDPMLKFGLERWRVPLGLPVYEHPDPASKALTKYSRAMEVTTIGVPMDNSADHVNWQWRAVLVTTGALDGKVANKIGFIQRFAPGVTAGTFTPEWAAAVLAAMTDPAFRGGNTVDTGALERAAYNQGRDQTVAAASAVPRK